jgi:YegS/Rv2252/BmrU family lipid kinase
MPKNTKVIVFYNNKSGHSKYEKHRDIIQSHFQEHNIECTIVEVPQPQDELNDLISQAIDEGVSLFIAAGGDGTASLIGNPLIGTGMTMGILPLGTGNLLAKELKIPVKIKKALELITDTASQIIQIDTFSMEARHYILNLSVGLTPKVMQGTESEEKKRFGLFAYFVHFLEQLLGLKLHRFEIIIDGENVSYTASEILITNSRATGLEHLEWADNVEINDGALDMFVIRAANIFDIVGLIISIFTKQQKRNPVVKIHQIKDHCRISSPSPLPTQADGDPLGETPVEIKVKPNSLNVIVGKKDLYQNFQRRK